jgi:hypothetical protein
MRKIANLVYGGLDLPIVLEVDVQECHTELGEEDAIFVQLKDEFFKSECHTHLDLEGSLLAWRLDDLIQVKVGVFISIIVLEYIFLEQSSMVPKLLYEEDDYEIDTIKEIVDVLSGDVGLHLLKTNIHIDLLIADHQLHDDSWRGVREFVGEHEDVLVVTLNVDPSEGQLEVVLLPGQFEIGYGQHGSCSELQDDVLAEKHSILF